MICRDTGASETRNPPGAASAEDKGDGPGPHHRSDGVAFQPQLTSFSGPLDLLLYLIHKNEVDIFHIPIATILEQYMEHLKILERNGLLSLDEGGEFLVLAARLMEIKSRMLLPAPEAEIDEELLEEDLEDPRRSLVEQLLEYKEIKERALMLEAVRRDRALRYERLPEELPAPEPARPDLSETTVWDLCTAFQHVVDELRQREAFTTVPQEEIPVEEVIANIEGRLQGAAGGTLPFRELFRPELGLQGLISYFLGLLEMARLRLVLITQDQDFGEILLTRRVLP
ncbi:MAG: segregation and condensation protein A [Planctomycetota bacterium]